MAPFTISVLCDWAWLVQAAVPRQAMKVIASLKQENGEERVMQGVCEWVRFLILSRPIETAKLLLKLLELFELISTRGRSVSWRITLHFKLY